MVIQRATGCRCGALSPTAEPWRSAVRQPRPPRAPRSPLCRGSGRVANGYLLHKRANCARLSRRCVAGTQFRVDIMHDEAVASAVSPSVDIKVLLPGDGVIRVESQLLFGEPDAPLCRRFIERAFLAPQIEG